MMKFFSRSSKRPSRTPESFLHDPFHPTTMLAVTAVMITMALGTLALQMMRG
ncbi:MAG: hypothetical protein WD872_18180 [Pirellulaceae bacterium]